LGGAGVSIPLFQVDAFADRPFEGNPAAVCLLSRPADERWMQLVAREMNLSETAFLYPLDDGFSLRWFTPAVEVDLCGHATLASAHVLWEQGYLKPDEAARFHTRSGILTARQNGQWIEMDFPATPAQPADPPDGLLDALGVTAEYVGKTRFDYLVEVDSEATVRDLKPDFGKLAHLPVRGTIVTSRADSPEFDFVSRFFAPAAGINEDPVTGSAHCCLAPYWAARLGKRQMVGRQLSERDGTVRVAMAGDRVLLAGKAVTIFRGELSRSALP
jgi:PhzF family phenazine biosynthesis protein